MECDYELGKVEEVRLKKLRAQVFQNVAPFDLREESASNSLEKLENDYEYYYMLMEKEGYQNVTTMNCYRFHYRLDNLIKKMTSYARKQNNTGSVGGLHQRGPNHQGF